MSLAKLSQLSLDGEDILVSDPFLSVDGDPMLDDLSLSDKEDLSNQEVLFEIEQSPDGELLLTLEKVPGADDQEDLVVEEELEVSEPEEVEINDDPWAWKLDGFLPWLSKMMQSVPPHDGKSESGIERAIAYLSRLDKECSKAVRSDLNNVVDINAVELARSEMHKGRERLEDRLERIVSSRSKRKKSKAEYAQDGLIKEARGSNVRGIVVSVPLLISSLARSCINGCVSAGKDIEELFVKLSKQYDLSAREKLELAQLLSDLNFPIRRDLGMPLDEPIDTTSVNNVNWAANYYA